jgi:hypothetical protein
MNIWVCSELNDIFKNSKPSAHESKEYEIDMARNEGESFQIGVFADEKALEEVKIEVVKLDDSLKCDINCMGFVKFPKNSIRAGHKILRGLAPFEAPEILLNSSVFSVPLYESRSAIITIWSSEDTRPGVYTLELSVVCGESKQNIFAKITVYNVNVPKTEDSVYQQGSWANLDDEKSLELIFKIKRYSDEYWTLNENYAKQLYKERQTYMVFRMEELLLEDCSIDESGNCHFNFESFDRYAKIYMDILKPRMLCGMHLLHRDWAVNPMPDHSFNQRGLMTWVYEKNSDGKVVIVYKSPSDPAAIAFHISHFTALHNHLKEKGWDKLWVQYVADEIDSDIQYEQTLFYYKLVHKYMPGARTQDACRRESISYFGRELDIHTPISWMHNDTYEAYDEINNNGTEVWQYTCLQPQFNYMGRIGDYHLMGNRLLHWYSFKFNLKGYLHYAWNTWRCSERFDSPEENASCFSSFPCDAWIVYPDRENLSALWSIRGVGNRDSAEDFEIMHIASQKDPESVQMIVSLLLSSAEDYTLNEFMLKSARKELLKIAQA